jgi:natural product precursor
MKPKKTKKLTLKKVTITNLNNSDMRHLHGGGDTAYPQCPGPSLPPKCIPKTD